MPRQNGNNNGGEMLYQEMIGLMNASYSGSGGCSGTGACHCGSASVTKPPEPGSGSTDEPTTGGPTNEPTVNYDPDSGYSYDPGYSVGCKLTPQLRAKIQSQRPETLNMPVRADFIDQVYFDKSVAKFSRRGHWASWPACPR